MVPAGLSQLSVRWKDLALFTDKSRNSLNNNWLTVLDQMELYAMDVPVDGQIKLSAGLETTVSLLKPTTHIRQLIKHAQEKMVNSISLV